MVVVVGAGAKVTPLVNLLILALATAAISTTISLAKVFASVRTWVKEKNSWLGELISCPYCTSHYVAFAVVLASALAEGEITVVLAFISTFAVVGLSGLIIGLLKKLLFSSESGDVRDKIKKMSTALELSKDEIKRQRAKIAAYEGMLQEMREAREER